MDATYPIRRLTRLAAICAVLVSAACGDQAGDPTGPAEPAFAKGGPNQPPTNDGRIFFASRMTGNSDIFSINPDGTDLRRLTFTAEEETDPAVSPDGRTIAFLKGPGGGGKTDLWIMNADGKRPQLRLAVPAGIYNFYGPTWSPDGRLITFSYIENDPPNARRIASINAKNGAMVTYPVEGMYPSWSPDGKYLAYTRPDGATSNLFTSHTDGADVRQYTQNFDFCCGVPRWSPFGDRVLFIARVTDNAPLLLYTANFNDQNVPTTLLSSSMSYNQVAWSRDAAKIAFGDGSGDLYVSLANGAGAVKILAGAQAWSGLSWSR